MHREAFARQLQPDAASVLRIGAGGEQALFLERLKQAGQLALVAVHVDDQLAEGRPRALREKVEDFSFEMRQLPRPVTQGAILLGAKHMHHAMHRLENLLGRGLGHFVETINDRARHSRQYQPIRVRMKTHFSNSASVGRPSCGPGRKAAWLAAVLAAGASLLTGQESRLANLSTRAQSGTGADALTAGFVVGPGGDKQILIRAIGPTLGSFGLTGVLADPVVTLYNSANAAVATNDNWSAANASVMTSVGAFSLPTGSADAAIVTTLAPGSYTAQVTGANGATGLALVEVYEVGATTSQLVNISTRAQVGTGTSVVIPGLALTGTGSRKLLVRAVGPGLSAFGVTGVLADPVLSLTNAAGTTTYASNDNWGTPISGGASAGTLTSAFNAAGAFGLTARSADAAVLAGLAPGNYTIQVSGVNNTSGLALVEVYDVTGATITTVPAGTSDSSVSAAAATAAQAFVATLTSAQQSTVVLPWSLASARRWSNLPASSNFVARNGIAWSSLTTAQRTAAAAMLSAVLSGTGQTLREGLQAADDYLSANGGGSSYGSGLYYLSIYGTPSATGFWVMQWTGHHLTYNFTFNGTYRSGTPLFLGVEPRTTFTTGGATYDPMVAQRTAASDLFTALPSYSGSLLSGTYTDILFGANGQGNIDNTYPKAYPTTTTNRGVLVSGLSTADQEKVKAFVRSYVNTQTDAVATELLNAYLSDAALAQTYVAYTGSGVTASNSYLRIDGPRVWIEFSVQGGVIIRNEPHYHSIWRDKVGDYGGNF